MLPCEGHVVYVAFRVFEHEFAVAAAGIHLRIIGSLAPISRRYSKVCVTRQEQLARNSLMTSDHQTYRARELGRNRRDERCHS